MFLLNKSKKNPAADISWVKHT